MEMVKIILAGSFCFGHSKTLSVEYKESIEALWSQVDCMSLLCVKVTFRKQLTKANENCVSLAELRPIYTGCERGRGHERDRERGDFEYEFSFILKAVIYKKNGVLRGCF